MSFSDNSGGTLALPSPTHSHQIDVNATVRTLRRTLSRSPSKLLSRSSSYQCEVPEASAQSPSRRYRSTPQHQQAYMPFTYPSTAPPAVNTVDPSHLRGSPNFSPLRNTKLSLRSVKSSKTLSPRPLARARASPKSPLKRALNSSSDTGNPLRISTPSPASIKLGQENISYTPRSPLPSRRCSEKSSRHSLHLDVSGSAGSPQHSFLTSLGSRPQSPMHTPTGALKRSDATMNLDQPAQESPVAKRRSMHGVSSLGQGEDFNIFNFGTPPTSQPFDIHDDSNQLEYELIGTNVGEREQVQSPFVANASKRASSLRKSTLQQRHGEFGGGLLSRRVGSESLSESYASGEPPSTPAGLTRPRLFTDHFKPPSATATPSAKEIPFSFSTYSTASTFNLPDTRIQQPHPLSKTVTTSSSGGSSREELQHDTSMRAPPRQQHPFSKSLPLNATRPMNHPLHDHNRTMATPSQANRLWAGAFNSTGLISKVNRNPEEESEKKLAPPDTPCKRPSNPFATFPPPSGSAKKKRPTNNRNSFAGVASTPFKPFSSAAPDTFGKPGRGLSIFQRGRSAASARRGSLLGLDDDQKLFGESDDFTKLADSDVPPTPTRPTLPLSLSNVSEQSQESPSANRTIGVPTSAVRPVASRQLSCK